MAAFVCKVLAVLAAFLAHHRAAATDFVIGDYEVAAPTPETRSAISLRKDRDDDQFTKMTVAFKSWHTISPLFRQCSNDDETVDVQFRYLSFPSNSNRSMTRYLPYPEQTAPEYTRLTVTSHFDCLTQFAASTYKQCLSYESCKLGWSFLCFLPKRYHYCFVSNTAYDITLGQKCFDEKCSDKQGVFIIDE